MEKVFGEKSLFDDEQIMKIYCKDMENTLAHKKDRELSLEKIARNQN